MPNDSAAAFIARWRIGIGFLFGAIVFWLAVPTRATIVAGVILGGAGEALRIWAAGHLHKSQEVTTSGPYRLFVHPLYVGSSIMGAGLALASGSLIVAVLIALYLLVALPTAARRETAFLKQTFGESYERYRSGRVASDARMNGVERRFSLARAFANREDRALLGFLLAALLLALKARANV